MKRQNISWLPEDRSSIIILNTMFFIKTFFVLGLSLFWSSALFARPVYDYLVRQPMSLHKIASRHFTRVRKIKYRNLKIYQNHLKSWNPHIKAKDYKEVPAGTEVYLDIPYSPYLPKLKYADDLRLGHQSEETNYYSMNLGVGIFQRKLTQEVKGTDLNLEAIQRSPVSLNGSFFMASRGGDLQLGTDFNISHLLASTSNVSDDFPASQEYGVAPFISYDLSKKYKFKTRLGVKYQRFVTFNLEELSQNQNVEMIKYDIGYLFGGLSWSHNLFGIYSTLGLSYSSSIWSQNDRKNKDPSFTSQIIRIENLFERERVVYGLFYELEESMIEEVDSQLTRFGANIRFYLF